MFLLLLLFSLISVNVNCDRILAVIPEKAVSHQIIGTSLLFALADKGHNVTLITTMVPRTVHENVTIVEVNLDGHGSDEINFFDFIHSMWILEDIFIMNLLTDAWTEQLLKDDNVQKLLSSDLKFDLVLIDVLGNYAHKGFCYYYNAICATINVYGADYGSDAQMGNPNNPSYIPDRFRGFTSSMNFFQRFYNSYAVLLKNLNFYFVSLPAHTAIMRKYFPGAPDLKDLHYNVSLSLVNSHFSNSYVTANLPNVVEIAGIHIKTPKELPADIKEFLDNSKDGVIYFSMGSILKSKDMRKERVDNILSAFARLKQNILWKYEDDTIQLPSNVKVVKWISQIDVLAHPNIRVFITHGGLLSITEAIYAGVPIVGIPIFADQTLNINLASESGFGVYLPYTSLTELSMTNAVNLILNNPNYSLIAKQKSKIYHDQLTKPLDRAVYWIEYCLRHRGAHHLRSPALKLYWYQYLLLDVLAVFLGGLIVVIVIIKVLFRKLCTKVVKKKAE